MKKTIMFRENRDYDKSGFHFYIIKKAYYFAELNNIKIIKIKNPHYMDEDIKIKVSYNKEENFKKFFFDFLEEISSEVRDINVKKNIF